MGYSFQSQTPNGPEVESSDQAQIRAILFIPRPRQRGQERPSTASFPGNHELEDSGIWGGREETEHKPRPSRYLEDLAATHGQRHMPALQAALDILGTRVLQWHLNFNEHLLKVWYHWPHGVPHGATPLRSSNGADIAQSPPEAAAWQASRVHARNPRLGPHPEACLCSGH